MKKIIILFFLINLNLTYGQIQFNYKYYVDETVRNGYLFFNKDNNSAVYLDEASKIDIVNNDSKVKSDAVFSISGKDDFSYFKSNSNQLIFINNLLKVTYVVNDSLPLINWNLIPDRKEIQNYTCYKATTTFRGRNWTAWYCPEIPIIYGPWKFYGLPGLIMEITEDTNRFSFILTDIYGVFKMDVPNVDSIKGKKVGIKDFVQLRDEAFDINDLLNDVKFRGLDMNVTKTITKGIELKYEWEE